MSSFAVATVAALVPMCNDNNNRIIIPFADAKASRMKSPRCCSCSCSGTSMTSTTSTTGRRRRRRSGHVLPNANAALPSANEGDANSENEFVFAAGGEEEDEEEEREEARCEIDKLTRAMENARRNERLGFSPGAGLSSEESAEAAFADLINTSNDANDTKTDTYDFDDDDKDKDEEFLSQLTKGARMDKSALSRKDTNKGGILGDLLNLGSILLRGGHIEKQKDGRV
jgi:hypothetical protein